jgi:hypothetical protein
MLRVMINRRKAIVGYAAWLIAARIARRMVRRKLSGLRPGALRNGGEGLMLNKTKAAPQAVADRASTIVETVRPIVNRALSDPELHAAIKQAFDTGRQVSGEVKGKPPKKAAKKLATDRKLQKKVETSAADLQKAVSQIVSQPRRKSRVKRVLGTLVLVGGAAAAVVVILRKLRGGGEETPY